jgi:hypothetical protein
MNDMMPMGIVPVRCKSALSVRRVYDIVDRLNAANSRFPLTAYVASGPEDLTDEDYEDDERWVEVTCASPGKMRHFLERMELMLPAMEKLERAGGQRAIEEEERLGSCAPGGMASPGVAIIDEIPF